jgi:hypothetical protein
MSPQKGEKELLVITLKKPDQLARLLNQPLLVCDPFYKAASRLKYRPDLFRFSSECEKVSELPAVNGKPLSWADCCFSRARELIDRSGSGPLYLSWSGGIDSTCMVASVLKVATAQERARIVAVYSHHSVLENPSFFRSHVAALPFRNMMRGISGKLATDGGMFVTGELGDQLFGSDLLMLGCARFGEQIIRSPFKDNVPKVIEANTGVPGSGKAIFERFLPIVDECPYPVKTTHDFFWWTNFTQKWQYVKFRFYELASWDPAARYGEQLFHFYDTADFQLWSLHNPGAKIKDTWLSYKFTAKNFLRELTGDESQLGLLKIQSIEKTYLADQTRIATTKSRSFVGSVEELATYATLH